MNAKHRALGRILKTGFLPNLIDDALDPLRLAGAAREAGILALEISCRRPDTLDVLARLKRAFPDMAFGVASLIEDGAYYGFLQKRGPRFPSIDQAVEAGADFLVSMIAFQPETYRRYPGIAIIPGVESPNEAKLHVDWGASLVKFSGPALRGGPAYFKSMVVCGPLHRGLPVLVTGGVKPELIEPYVEAGVLAAAAGFDLILGQAYKEFQKTPDWPMVRDALGAYVAAFAEARARHRPGVDFASADPAVIEKTSGLCLNA